MVTAGILPFRENSHSKAGNRTRDLIIGRQRLWPLDHEAGHYEKSKKGYLTYVRYAVMNDADSDSMGT